MTISIRSIAQATSMRQQALNQNLTNDGSTPYTPFALRELVTPQYQIDTGEGLDMNLDSDSVVAMGFSDVSAVSNAGGVSFTATVSVSDPAEVDTFSVKNVRVVFEDETGAFMTSVRIGTISTLGFERKISVSLDRPPETVEIETGRIQIDPRGGRNEHLAIIEGLHRTGGTTYDSRRMRFQRNPFQTSVDSSRENWANWVRQHSERRTEYRPTNHRQLLASVVEKAQSDGRIRAVGSGHSHSNAPEAPEQYIDLNPAEPEEATDEALNGTLEHRGWLKSDDELQQLYDKRDHGDGETHPFDKDHLKRVEAGLVLRRLNRHILHENGYALKNMGSFDGQTVAGAVNTSTHGTGINLSSFADSVESVEIATVPESESGDPIIRLYRIEPSDGITDREAFERAVGDHEMELIQDDDIFYSTVVGYGCMGVAYAYTLHVRDNYWLKETTDLIRWIDLELALTDDQGNITRSSVKDFLTKDGCRHTQILVNIAADQVPAKKLKTHTGHGTPKHETPGNPLCLVKRHFEVSNPPDKPDYWDNPAFHIGDKRWPPERPPRPFRYLGKDISIHLLAPNKNKAKILHNRLFHPTDKNAPFFEGFNKSAWYIALRRLRDGGNKTGEFYNPEPPEPPTPTVEVGVALENIVDAVKEARSRIQTIKQGDQIKGKVADTKGDNVFFPAPMGIRFTAASEHYLSPEHRYDDSGNPIETGMVEVPLPIYDVNDNPLYGIPDLSFHENRKWVVEPALSKLHNHLVFTANSNIQFAARPHMGKHNRVGDGWLKANYDKYASSSDDETAWLDVYDRFNAFGTFNNKFTKQLGIDN